MKLFVLDQGWTGSVLVYAESAEEALEAVKNDPNNGNYLRNGPGSININSLEEIPMKNGIIHVTRGDQ